MSIETRVVDTIRADRILAFLEELIAFRSLGGEEGPVQERMATMMESIGMDVDAWTIDMERLREHPAYSAEVERTDARGVVGTRGRGDGPTLILNGHVDVVPAGDLERWSVPPWKATLKSGRVYGRGSVDMKGALCCAMVAVEVLREAGVELDGTVQIQSVIGEEDGGCGTLAAIERGYTGDGAIVLEPTECMVAPAQAGAFNFRLTVPGRAAHGALRTEGVDPFEKYLVLYEAMRAFEQQRNAQVNDPLFADYNVPFALCIGTIRSGIWASTVAESLTCEGRLGVGVDEDPVAVRRAFESVIQDAAQTDPWLRDHPPTLTWWGGQFAPAATDPNHTLVQTLANAHKSASGKEAVLRGMPYGSDMRLLVNQGDTPTVLYGPGDVRRAHAPDEFVPIKDLVVVTRTLALTILRFCGTQNRG